MATKTSIFSSVISESPMITSEKLVGSENYLSWSASVELWFMGQGYEDHLVTQEADILEVERVQWRKIDAQLCSVLWQSVDPKILLHLRAYKTCFKFWTQAKGLYTNDIQRLYKIASLQEEFLTVMPLTPDVGAQQTQLDKFFMVLTLIGLRSNLEPVHDQILGGSSVPSLDDVFAHLLRISSTQTLPSDSISDSSVLVSHTTSRGGRSGNRGRGQRPHCTYCNKLGHTRDRCYQLHGRPPRTAHVAQSSDSQLPQPPSSSASQASQAFDLFSSITTTSDLPVVTLANGSQTVAKGPEYGKTIGIGRESQGLYHLTSDSSPTVCISTDAPLLIHSRLGHPNLSKFEKMVPCFSTLSSLSCESCQLGKHTPVSFPKRLNNRAKSPFELIHTDVWGPCQTASTLEFQYFVTFIDDYSRCTCDNAREYFSAPFTSFMSHNGILHQSSCAHTPQQNWVAERKNRHLVETTHTILLHSNVPFRFWGDAVLTACYLINCMPSSVLHDQIPHFLLFPDQPLYFFPPRVFGCTCFVHILTPGQDKLSAKAMNLAPSYCLPSDVVPPRPLQAYHRRPRVAAPLPFAKAPADSLPIPSASPAPALPSPDDLPIAIRKGWRQAMVDEMDALHSNGTWDLVVLPSGKFTVGCRWVYAVKVGPDGQVDRLKAHLVAKGYTQVYGSDYGDTFSPVAKIASVCLLLSMAAMCSWPLYQLDIKNAFLHGDLGLVCRLRRSLYGLKQSPRAWFGRFSSVVQEFDMLCSSDQDDIQKLKQHLFTHFQTKNLGKLKYLLGIEIAQSSSGVVLSQRKYALDILKETGMLDCKPIDTPMDPNVKLVLGQGEPLGDPRRYRRLVGKLNYLTITRPDISFPVSVVSQFLQSPCDSHWDVVIRILQYIKSTPGQGVLYENKGHTQVVGYTDADWAGSPIDRRSTSGYCVFIGGNLISWKSKKQDVVARSSAEAKYRAMALTTCELIWLRHLLRELRFGKDEQMKLICNNQAALHIASNPVFHERTKHIEVDCHFIREKIASGCVATSFVNSNDQLADIFTKSLRGPRIKYICNKLGAYDVYAPA
ncbi:Retrovirus-related Pol polyprotein from transposon RE1 [Vitis vinifera]|uniref:Retrovirus-related Pol polyprotein from transposon RE1 n=1 Tax=Vitis vinifera TaxID=29760 RepID=A0A438FYS6_VITVI|nr:Retrovirus-related Pol polyprotein from transposon RE1 [Vitis vinifera]